MRISMRRQNERLLLVVENDGAHRQAEQRSGGIGLRNTRARIQEIHGASGTLHLTVRDGGARFEIELPVEDLSDAA